MWDNIIDGFGVTGGVYETFNRKTGLRYSRYSSILSIGSSAIMTGVNIYTGNYRGAFEEATSAGLGFFGSKYGGAILGSFGAGLGFDVALALGGSALLGSFIGGAIFAAVGIYFGGKLLSHIGKYIGGFIYDNFIERFTNNSIKAAEITGSGDTGGVEFIIPKIIPNFKDNFCFSDNLFISFKKYSTSTEQDILNLLNNKLLINGAKFKNMNEVFSTILNELSIGYLVDKKLPFISLNFNKDGLLYPIMDEYYKHTLVGCIITMLDYYLKCYVNGGFFKEEFIYEWQKTKNTDKFYLENNFINMKKYLLSIIGDKNEIAYESLNDMKASKNNQSQIFLSAFRIIGKIDNKISYYKNLILPKCYYDVEYDIDISPEFKASAYSDENKQKIIKDNEIYHKLMAFNVKTHMKLVPYFKPYFELLNIIIFCLHYLPNIQACGVFLNFSNSLINGNKKYMPNIPNIFPPLPVKKTIELDVSITMKDLIPIFSNVQKIILNKIISFRFLESKNRNDIKAMKINNESIEKEITKYVNEKKLKPLLDDNNSFLVDITNDEKLGINVVIGKFSEYLNYLVCYKVIKSCFILDDSIKSLKKGFNINDTYSFDLEKLIESKTLRELNIIANELINDHRSILNKTRKIIIEKSNNNIQEFKNELENKRRENINISRNDFRKKIEADCLKYHVYGRVEEFMNSVEVKNILTENEKEINKYYDNIYNEKINEFNKHLNEKLELLTSMENDETKLKNSLTRLENDLRNYAFDFNEINDEILESLKIQYHLNLQSLCFDLSSDVVSKIETRGGCLIKINKNLWLNESNIGESLFNNIIKGNTDEYYSIKSEIINAPAHGDSLNKLVKTNYDRNMNQLIESVMKNENNKTSKDFYGFSQGHYKALLGDFKSIKPSDLNSTSDSGVTPELIAVTMGNYKMVSELMKKNNSNFSSPSPNGITSLLTAIFNKDEMMINLLLDHPNKIGDINYTNELNKTYLHYVCEYNMPDITKRIINLNGNMTIQDKKFGNSPLHLVCQNSSFETLKGIIEIFQSDHTNNYKNINFNIQRPDKRTPFHFSSKNSILCTKLLIRNNIANPSIQDCYGDNCYYSAIYSGRLDCYQQFQTTEYNKRFKETIKNAYNSYNNHRKSHDKIKYLKELFKNGQIKEIEQVISSMKNELPITNYDNCIELIDAACKGRKKDSIKYLSQLFALKKYPLMTFIGKNGLIDWIKEAIGFGCDLYESYHSETIFDCCIESDDILMLQHIFNFIDTVDKKFNTLLSNMICKVAIQNKTSFLRIISVLLELPKFKKSRISINSLCNTPKVTSTTFMILIENFKWIDLSTVDLFTAIKYTRPSVFREMVKLKKMISSNDLIKLEKNGKTRQDNLSILAEFYPERFNKYRYNPLLLESIETLLTKKEKLIENEKELELRYLLQEVNVGLTELTKDKELLPHLIMKYGNLWAMKSLPDNYAEFFFIENEQQYSPFDYTVEYKNTIEFIFDYFDSLNIDRKKKSNYILLSLDKIISNINELKMMDLLEIENFKNILNKYNYIFNYYNNNQENLFYILSKYPGLDIKDLFKSHSQNIDFNHQNIEGNTILMNLIENRNFEMVKDIINGHNINFETCNKEGDSYLHLLFREPISTTNYDEESLKLFYETTLTIISRKPSNVLLQNRKGETPYILASKIGNNTGLFLMSLFYPSKLIENYSINTTALHESCYMNKVNTVRYLVEYLNYDINQKVICKENHSFLSHFNSYSTPLHCAAKSSSLDTFKLLLQYGANPFIEDINHCDAITIALENGDKKMLEFLFNTPFMIHNSFNNSHLISLVKNPNAEKYVNMYITCNSIFQFNSISDENMNNLLMISCINNNPSMVNFFIETDIEILSQNKYGNNVLHLCCYSNSMSCASEILSIVEEEFIHKLLNIQNKEGETPLHVASDKGHFSLVALFLSYMNSNNKTFIKNNSNLSFIQQSIKSNNFDITLLFMEFYKLTLRDIKNMNLLDISFELDQFIIYYNNNKSKNEKVKDKLSQISVNKLESIDEVIQTSSNDNVNENELLEELSHQKIIDYKSYNGFNSILSKYCQLEIFNETFFIKYKSIIGNLNTLLVFKKWYLSNKAHLINKFITILSKVNGNKSSLEICEIFLNYILSQISSEYAEAVLNEMNELVLFCNSHENTQYFVKIINSVIISALSSNAKINVCNNLIPTIKDFRLLVESQPIQILENLKSIKFNISAYDFINNLIRMCNLKPHMALIQIKYANFIPPLLSEEVDELIQKYPIIHECIDSVLPIDKFIKTVLSSMKNISPEELDISLKCDQYLKNSKHLIITEKISLIENMLKILKMKSFSVITKELFSFIKAAEIYIVKSGKLKKIDKLIDNSKSLSDIILKLNTLNELPEFNFDDFANKLDMLLSRIGLDDNPQLKKLAQYFNIYYVKFGTNKNYSELGRQFGQEFRQLPTMENMAKLLAILSRGFEEVMKFTPYLIQILAIGSFLIHYTKNQNQKQKNIRGRIAQIKTGEGKSMIIAMLALSNALMGYFVDVITSTHYLAERDQVKFKKLFSLFGISSSNIIDHNPAKEDYDGIILYGTNTDFEFTLLREGVFIQNKNMTKPIDKNQLITREYHVSIVDECDNLFLDTALSSARIAYSSKYHYNWVYIPIFKYVKDHPIFPNIQDIRDLLNNYENGIHQTELLQISNEKLRKWVDAAKSALSHTINKDYIIGFNEKLQKKEIQIISSDTGRILHGSRWSNGVHEFVEVKEGLIPEEESSVIASICHPTYFQNYQTIFGLTGTIGEEIEKNEISEMYNVELYHLPRNFTEKLIIEKSEILDNQEQKYNRIIKLIQNNNLKQPMLILLENIQESIDFFNRLKDLGMDPLLLNDAQKEKEEYILEKAGNIGSILVSTNAAGRGTDILLSQEALEVGGLYVILGFFPKNSRIEYQGIGRAGRQGQKGKAKIVFSKDEWFVQEIVKTSSWNNNPNSYIDKTKYYYQIRNEYITRESNRRMKFIETERVCYKVLSHFFSFKRQLLQLFEDSKIKSTLKSELKPYSKFLMSHIDQLWADYYSEKIAERNHSLSEKTDNELFISFIEYFLKEFEFIQSHDPHYKNFKNNILIKKIISIKSHFNDNNIIKSNNTTKGIDYIYNRNDISNKINKFNTLNTTNENDLTNRNNITNEENSHNIVDEANKYFSLSSSSFNNNRNSFESSSSSSNNKNNNESSSSFIYFKKPHYWGMDVYVYLYSGDREISEWPGYKMTDSLDDFYSYEIQDDIVLYYYDEIDEIKIIFNDNSGNQSPYFMNEGYPLKIDYVYNENGISDKINKFNAHNTTNENDLTNRNNITNEENSHNIVDEANKYFSLSSSSFNNNRNSFESSSSSSNNKNNNESSSSFIYFKKPHYWGMDVYVYLYSGDREISDWPGYKMTDSLDDFYSYEIQDEILLYYYDEIDEIKIIFNDNSGNQSPYFMNEGYPLRIDYVYNENDISDKIKKI